MRKLTNFNSSYQYTWQCINELLEEKIIVKRGFKYELSMQWLEQLNKFSRQSVMNYKFGIKNNLLTKETTQISVRSLEELGNFMLDAFENRFLERKDNKGFYCFVSHLWIPFINKEKQDRLINIKEKVNVVYTKNALLDKILDKTCYKKYVNSIKYVNKEIECNYFVYNNCVFQVYFPNKLNKLMDNLYSGNIDVFKKIADLFAMTYKEFPINIIITRNKEIAKKHREIIKKI